MKKRKGGRNKRQFVPTPPLPKLDIPYVPTYKLFHDPDQLCDGCGLPLGERFSPVTNSGLWFHYICCRRYLGETDDRS